MNKRFINDPHSLYEAIFILIVSLAVIVLSLVFINNGNTYVLLAIFGSIAVADTMLGLVISEVIVVKEDAVVCISAFRSREIRYDEICSIKYYTDYNKASLHSPTVNVYELVSDNGVKICILENKGIAEFIDCIRNHVRAECREQNRAPSKLNCQFINNGYFLISMIVLLSICVLSPLPFFFVDNTGLMIAIATISFVIGITAITITSVFTERISIKDGYIEQRTLLKTKRIALNEIEYVGHKPKSFIYPILKIRSDAWEIIGTNKDKISIVSMKNREYIASYLESLIKVL